MKDWLKINVQQNPGIAKGYDPYAKSECVSLAQGMSEDTTETEASPARIWYIPAQLLL